MKPFLAFCALSLVACGGAKSEVLTTPDSGTGTGLPLTGDAGLLPGTPPVAACVDGNDNPSSIAGNWIVVDTSGSSSSAISIDANDFSFVLDDHSLVFHVDGSGSMTLNWNPPGQPVPITTTQVPAPFDLGVFPIAAGGNWTFASPSGTQQCQSTVAADTFSTSCNGVEGTPVGTLLGSANGTRTATASSIFGALGGQWHLTSSPGTDTTDVTIVGNTFSAVTTGAGPFAGTINVRVCNGTASGATSHGLEFTATRE